MKALKVIFAALLFWFTSTVTAVPKSVVDEVTQYPKVYVGACKWQHVRGPCKIFFDERTETVYLVFYTPQKDAVTYVVKIIDEKETVLYENVQYSV